MSNLEILKMNNISKTFNTVKALDNVSFSLNEGEIHCIVGENGAGKSTFIKILSGAYGPDGGEILLFGEEYKSLTPSQARGLGIQTIYQETNIIPDMSVMENVFMGIENKKGRAFIDFKRTRKKTKELIKQLNIEINPDAIVRELGVAEKQVVQIIKALAINTKILIMDEPTASFGRKEINVLLDLVRKIKSRGTSIIYISHHLEEVFEIADRVTVLKDGEVVAHHYSKDIDESKLVCEMVGRDASLFYKKEKHKIGEKILEIKNFTRGEKVKEVSLFLRKGEILGIAGMVGSGRSELARLICGADKKDSGELYINNKKVSIANPGDGIKNGICLLPEDRKKDGGLLDRDIKDNILIAAINREGKLFANPKNEESIGDKYVEMLKIKTPSSKQLLKYLSGGNQQKVLVARWLYANTEIFIFDEPTRGIDIGAKEEIYRLMINLVKEGKAIIMISSDMPELIAMSDKVLVMRNGSIQAELEGTKINEETILSHSIGGEA